MYFSEFAISPRRGRLEGGAESPWVLPAILAMMSRRNRGASPNRPLVIETEELDVITAVEEVQDAILGVPWLPTSRKRLSAKRSAP